MIVPGLPQSRCRLRGGAALLAVLLATGGIVRAQVPDGTTPENTESAQRNAEDLPIAAKPIDDEAPYSSWQTHVARKPEEAVVLVRYAATPDASAPLTTATGLVIRCDGFVLVPKAMREAAYARRRAEVVITTAEGASFSGPTAVPARPHPGVYSTINYALVKINGYHIRCLPMLAPENVTADMPVRVLWATAKDSGGFSVTSRDATIATPGDRNGVFTLTAGTDKLTDIPDGAIVIDGKSGAAIGVASSGGSSPVFTTFARIRAVSDDVGLAPDRAAVRLDDGQDIKPTAPAKMVWVPGGPIRVRSDSAFAKQYGTDVICMPGFFADEYPVTNQQYRDWLPTHKRRNLPDGWSYLEEQSPIRRGDLAATGMLREDAAKYASDHSLRLMTEAEWLRASCCEASAIRWIQHQDDRWNLAAFRIFQKLIDHIERSDAARRDAIAAAQANHLRVDLSKVEFVLPPAPGEFEALAQLVDDTLKQEVWMWGWDHPVGIYSQDVSIFGLHDVLTNPTEYLQYAERTSPMSHKISPAMVDQYWNDFQWFAVDSPDTVSVRNFYQKVFEILLWHNQWSKEVHGDTGELASFARREPYVDYQILTTRSNGNYFFVVAGRELKANYRAQLTSRCENSFRCAR